MTPWFVCSIGGNRIDVYRVRDLRDDEGELLDGRWIPAKNEIHIRDKMPPSRELVTLLHECFHAAESEFDVAVKHSLIYLLSSVAAQVVQQIPGKE